MRPLLASGRYSRVRRESSARAGRRGGWVALVASFTTACLNQASPQPVYDSDSGMPVVGDSVDGGVKPVTLTIPLYQGPVTQSGGSASSGGAGGASAVGGASVGGGTGAGGSTTGGSTSSTGGFPTVSAFCGDRVRDANKEECDDGPPKTIAVSRSDGDLCNIVCQVTDAIAVDDGTSDLPGSKIGRVLGAGRHPLAASESGIAVGLVQTGPTPSAVSVRVARFDRWGHRNDVLEASHGLIAIEDADPVVAMLPNGDTAVAFTDFDGDGDGQGIVVRLFRAGATNPAKTVYVSDDGYGAQYAPDIIALSDRFIVAWTDSSNVATGPDIRYRELGLDLTPLGNEKALSDSATVDSRVSLSLLGTSWGAAWRAGNESGKEKIEAFDAGANLRWSAGGAVPPSPAEIPVLLPLDAKHHLLILSGAPYANADDLAPSEIHLAVLSIEDTHNVYLSQIPVTAAYAPWTGYSRQRPAAVLSEDGYWLAWSSGALRADSRGEDVWFERVTGTVDGTNLLATLSGEINIPRWPSENLFDQRFPALALMPSSALYPKGALIAAWDDYSRALPNESHPDVVVQMSPLPMRRDANPALLCSAATPCAPGQGPCSSDDQCSKTPKADNVCDTNIGPQFGLGIGVGVCAPEHCRNTVRDADETGLNCGGSCGACTCGDGIPSPLLGEECDSSGVQSELCEADCQLPACGDGVVNPKAGEQCDPEFNPLCTSDCHVITKCSDPNGCLSVWAVAEPTDNDNKVLAHLYIHNNSLASVPMNHLELRYWFTEDGTQPLEEACDWSALGCSSEIRALSALSPVLPGADHVLKMTFVNAPTLAPGDGSGELQTRINKQDWTAFNELNDFSYPGNTSIVPANNIALYLDGKLVWGNEPKPASCGNGVVETGEECDDGHETAACNANCTLRRCGDSIVNVTAGEQCDNGPLNSPTCDSDCSSPYCNDGIWNPAAGEVCDPTVNAGCNSTCTGWTTQPPTGCSDATTCLHAEHRYADGLSDNQVRPILRIVNNGASAVTLRNVTLRYWFTADSSNSAYNEWCDWASLFNNTWDNQCSLILQNVLTMPSARTQADHYLELSFNSDIQLTPGTRTEDMQIRLTKTDWSNFNETDDWSQTQSATMIPTTHVTLYVNGQLVWGQEP